MQVPPLHRVISTDSSAYFEVASLLLSIGNIKNPDIKPSDKKVRSIMKKKPIASSLTSLSSVGRIIKKPRRVQWSSFHSARIIRKETVVDSRVPTSQNLGDFFEQHQLKRSTPRRKKKKSVSYEKPENISEIARIQQWTKKNELKDQTDRIILRNFSRLVNKQKHIFSQKCNQSFQKEIKVYISLYKKEIHRRNLNLPNFD